METNIARRRTMSDSSRSQCNPRPPAVSPGQRLPKTTHPNKLRLTTLALALVLALAPQARAVVVSTLSDSGAGSLRSAITNLNATGPGTIGFSVTGTITLASDLPALTVPVTITGPGTSLLTISGGNSFRLFQLAANTTNRISGLTLANGYTATNNSGAAIYNLAYTVVINCLLVSNTVVGGFGGAVANFGTGTLLSTNCSFANNTVRGGNGDSLPAGTYGGAGGGGAGMGGAIYTAGTALTLSGCSFQSNVAAGGNGANGIFTSPGNTYNGSSGGYPNRGPGGAAGPGGSGGFGGGGGGGGYAFYGGSGGFGGGGGGGPESVPSSPGAGGTYGGGGGNGGLGSYISSGGGGGGAGLGGGIFASNGAVSVVNCSFTSNMATNGLGGSPGFGSYGGGGGDGQGVGGAIFALDGTLNLVNNTFSGNTASTAAPDFLPPDSFIVTSLADSGAGTLRDLVGYVNTNADANTIIFQQSLAGQTITLTNGQLTLSNTVTIDASALSNGIAVSGNNSSRVFEVAAGAVVNLSALNIQNGYAPNGNSPTNYGGGILNRGTLALTNCTLTANQAQQGSNPAGGGIENYSVAATLTLQSCLVSSNHSDHPGGGGGGIDINNGVASINQCTFTANSCTGGHGGGIFVEAGSATINQCTVSGNSATTGGGVALSGSHTISNSIVAGNVASSGSNIAGSFSGANNLTNGAPLLASLGNYGGPTLTMPPLPGSPAIDGCTGGTSFTTDQRGYPRIAGTNTYADIGAVEGVFNPGVPLLNPVRLGNGSFQFGFSNLDGPAYAVLAGTNVAAPLNTWSNLGPAVESPPGTFLFTDPQATNYPRRFYRVQGP